MLRFPSSFIVLLFLSAVFARPSWAQWERSFNPFPVIVAGDTLAIPFFGGINSPKPSLCDFDGDSLIDLFIGEETGKLNYLKNYGTVSEPSWFPVTDRFAGVDIGFWHLFIDIDGDGDLDLFCDNRNNGTTFYRNESTEGEIIFVKVDTAFGGFETGINNTPAFCDIDGDGDYDFFIGDPNGQLVFYRNDGNASSPAFTLVSTYYDSILAFPGGGKALPSEPQHGFSAIYWADIDDDGDLDLFWGDLFNANLYFFENQGTATQSQLTYATEFFLPISTFGYNHAPFADLDGDGDLDMMLGAANGENLNNLRLLRNVGTAQVPDFIQLDLNVIKNIDVGRSSFPDLVDIDGDGDFDLLIGSGDGRIRFFENIGDARNPVFQWVTDEFGGIDVGLSAAPFFVDWDSDGDLDLIVGNELGYIQYWRNDGDPCTFVPTLVSTQYAGIKVDFLAVPVAVDLNDDGLLDLIVGEWDFNNKANILLYENTGTIGNPQLTLVTDKLISIATRNFTIPSAVDWDGDGRIDLLVGGRGLGLTLYKNLSTYGSFPDSTTLIAQPDTIIAGDSGFRVSVRMVDIDSDGDFDIFTGEEHGGINFFRHIGGTQFISGDADGSGTLTVSDAVFLINFIFGGGPAPEPMRNGDADCNGVITVSDVVHLINYIFGSGAAPCARCAN